MRRFRSLIYAVTLAAGCGQGAVTDPLREGFAVDPRPVLGAWTVTEDLPAETFDVLVERDAGTLSGFFEYELWGRWWIVRFRDATWDGTAISFVEKTDFGQQPADSLVQWTASYAPAREYSGGSMPPRLTLTAAFGTPLRCCVVVMHYHRPGQEPFPADSLILIPLPGSSATR